jgi:6-pyruvoyltetrahydropterin/6-carboxytetrahydropterin synthase
MTKIRVTKIFEFDTAHALHNYDGLCSNIHGHTYKLHVTVIGEPIADTSSPKYGMVVDFGVLKNKIKENLVDKFDHSLIVSRDESDNFTNGSPIFRRIHVVDFQPTAENIVAHFAELINPLLPDGVELFSLRLYETSTSFAEWYASDNC